MDKDADDGEHHELSGVYDFTERLLFDKLWQGEDRSWEAKNGERRRRMEEEKQQEDFSSLLNDSKSANKADAN